MTQKPVPDSIGALLVQICRAHRNKAQELLSRLELYPGQEFLLLNLFPQDGLTHSEVAENLCVQPATVTRMLDRLVKSGFVQRRADTDDQRVSRGLPDRERSGACEGPQSERLCGSLLKPVLFAILPTVRTPASRHHRWQPKFYRSAEPSPRQDAPWRSLIAAAVAVAVGWGGMVYAANNSVQGAKKDEGGFDGDAPTAILIEASSGSVLFEKNADELRAPSSMMKLMTAEMVFHAIKQGEVKLTDEYHVSENAWRKGGAPAGGSTMFAAIHSKISVDDLLHGAIVQSGNDACMVLAEGIAGNERIFADMMTKRARELGMAQSTFANSNGLPDPGNKMTVRELARLARYIIQTYPEFYKLFGEKEFTWNKIRQQNRNPLLNSLEGADGLKTGYTKEGGYGMVGSAVQNGMRLIVVVNGLEDPDDRASEAKKMLEWGFRNFEARTLFAAQQQVGFAKVFGGDSRSVKLTSPAADQGNGAEERHRQTDRARGL